MASHSNGHNIINVYIASDVISRMSGWVYLLILAATVIAIFTRQRALQLSVIVAAALLPLFLTSLVAENQRGLGASVVVLFSLITYVMSYGAGNVGVYKKPEVTAADEASMAKAATQG